MLSNLFFVLLFCLLYRNTRNLQNAKLVIIIVVVVIIIVIIIVVVVIRRFML